MEKTQLPLNVNRGAACAFRQRTVLQVVRWFLRFRLSFYFRMSTKTLQSRHMSYVTVFDADGVSLHRHS